MDQLKLSICMMVKNEEKNIDRCLSSLTPILNSKIAELIIIDTGSSDNTVNIVRNYTDKVYFHKWNDNFSEMRNTSISYAKGEWIFIIDADESLLNATEIVNLMKTSEINKYNSIQLKVKNYTNLNNNKNNFTMFPSERIFRRDSSFQYKGSVHNQPIFKGPVLSTEFILEHFGYIRSDEELMEKKYERTVTLLRKELESDPNNIYYRYQLATSYSMYGKIEDAYQESKKAYNTLKNLNKVDHSLFLYVYGSFCNHSHINGHIDESIESGTKGLEVNDTYLDLYFLLLLNYQKLGKLNLVEKYAKGYLDVYEKFDDLRISKDASIVMYYNTPVTRDFVVSLLVNCLIKSENFEDAIKFSAYIEDEQKSLPLEVRIYIKTKQYKKLEEKFNSIKLNAYKQEFVSYVEQYKKELVPTEKKQLEQFIQTLDSDYGLLYRVKNNSEENFSHLNQIDFNKNPIFFGEVFKLIENKPSEIFNLMKKVSSTRITAYINNLLNQYPEIDHSIYRLLQEKVIRENDLHGNRVYIAIAYPMLYNFAKNNSSGKGIKIPDREFSIFINYVENGYVYLKQIYKEEKLRLIYSTLDNVEHQLILLLNFAIKAANNNQEDQAIRYLTEAVDVNPELVKFIKKLKENIL